MGCGINDGDVVTGGQVIATWDPHTHPIISEVAGDADILIVPSIESANIFGKSLTYYCNYRVAHVVMGAKVPILIASRADTAETKMLSIALSIMCA